jgi:hypothetical protein
VDTKTCGTCGGGPRVHPCPAPGHNAAACLIDSASSCRTVQALTETPIRGVADHPCCGGVVAHALFGSLPDSTRLRPSLDLAGPQLALDPVLDPGVAGQVAQRRPTVAEQSQTTDSRSPSRQPTAVSRPGPSLIRAGDKTREHIGAVVPVGKVIAAADGSIAQRTADPADRPERTAREAIGDGSRAPWTWSELRGEVVGRQGRRLSRWSSRDDPLAGPRAVVTGRECASVGRSSRRR